MRVERVPYATAEHRGSIESEPWSAETIADVTDEQDAQESRQRRPQSGSPMMNTECVVGSGGDPVLQRRLFEVLDAIQSRGHPVPGYGHLAGDLGVAAFVGMHQPAVVETGKPE